jgi:hypothetical protein
MCGNTMAVTKNQRLHALLLLLCPSQTNACCRPGGLQKNRAKKVSLSDVKHPPVKGVSHENMEARGLNIHVARAGIDPSKQLFLFLHGFPECALSFLSSCHLHECHDH